MFSAITKFFAAIPENANLRLLLSESRIKCADLQAECAALKLERAALQATAEQRDNQITELKNTVELLKREDGNKKLKEAPHHNGPLEPEWGEP